MKVSHVGWGSTINGKLNRNTCFDIIQQFLPGLKMHINRIFINCNNTYVGYLPLVVKSPVRFNYSIGLWTFMVITKVSNMIACLYYSHKMYVLVLCRSLQGVNFDNITNQEKEPPSPHKRNKNFGHKTLAQTLRQKIILVKLC